MVKSKALWTTTRRFIFHPEAIQPVNLSILYTAGIRGDLDTLPRLFTFIKELRRDITRFRPEDEEVMLCAVQPPEVRTLLLDLGDSCAPDVWHCAATDGRSTLIALDAMGYTAANVSGQITPASRAKLDENLLAMALVDDEHPWESDSLLVTCGATCWVARCQIALICSTSSSPHLIPPISTGGHCTSPRYTPDRSAQPTSPRQTPSPLWPLTPSSTCRPTPRPIPPSLRQ